MAEVLVSSKFEAKPQVSRTLKLWILLAGAIVGLLVVSLWAAVSGVSSSVFRTEASLVGAAMGGPIRILLPIVATLVCAPQVSAILNNRFVVYTRTRASIRGSLGKSVLVLVAQCFLVFFVIGSVLTAVAYWLMPLWFPSSVDPSLYNLTASEALASEASIAPLVNVLINHGAFAYVLSVGLWSAFHAVAFGLVAILAAILISRVFIAWLIPTGIFLFQSVMLQVLDFPAASFIGSATYPSGLSNFSLGQALLALWVLMFAAVATLTVIIFRAPVMDRFA